MGGRAIASVFSLQRADRLFEASSKSQKKVSLEDQLSV